MKRAGGVDAGFRSATPVPQAAGHPRSTKREVSGLRLDIRLGVILGGDLDSSGGSEENGSANCRLTTYLGLESVGSTYPPHQDGGC